jgi:NTE family protein
MKTRPRIGLALGGGAAKGYAHIGVLKVLEREKINIDCIAGTSIGSLIGALYCSGISIKMLEQLSYQIKRRHWVDVIIPKQGLLAGNKAMEIVRLLTKNKSFHELDIPLAVTATNLVTGKEEVLKEGNVAEAVRASISIPGIFVPVYKGDMVLVDGAVLDKVPVDAARQMGADIVIAVDLGFENTRKLNNIYDILLQTFDVMGQELVNKKIVNADIVIKPDLSDVRPSLFNQQEKCINRGVEAAEKVLVEIRKILDGDS